MGWEKSQLSTGESPLRKLRDAIRNFSRIEEDFAKPLGFSDIRAALGALLADHGEGIINRE